MQERHDIFVRAHAPLARRTGYRKYGRKWPEFALIFDTETTLNPAQKLTFGCYRICEQFRGEYRCFEEGLIYGDDLSLAKRRVLERYINDPANVPAAERVAPQIKLKLFGRTSFISRVFWRHVRSGDFVVGFNLPFDLSRLAVKATNGRKSSWSLIVSLRKSKKTGLTETNLDRPRIVITSINSKMAFVGLSSNWHGDEWPSQQPRFLDLRTLTWALRNESFSLNRACKAFGVRGKIDHKPTGTVSPKEIAYCREDVAATNRLLNAAKSEFSEHPIDLYPDEAYSPASVAKAYLDRMQIAHPKEHFKTSNKSHGIAMQAYYGGRAECRIRKTPVPVVLTDFTSQYPTVNALLGNWAVLKASGIRFEDYTSRAKSLVAKASLRSAFDPAFWKRLPFFALVKPDNDVLPVRTVYNGRTLNIGLNYLTSKEPVWYAGPDLIASVLLSRKEPRILKALQLVPIGEQRELAPTNLNGIVPIDPRKDDFFVRVIEQKGRFKRENKSLAYFLKVLANSGSYGLFIQVDPETRSKPTKVRVYSGENSRVLSTEYAERLGPWYFPPVASLITSGGRLLLAMLERSVQNAGGRYLFCDTDSMCIVASERGGLVPCAGGEFRLRGKDAIKALSFKKVRAIADQFSRLNPYDPELVPEILKIEDVNYVDSDPTKPPRQIFGYGVAAKRYALFTSTDEDISILKASGHGLGYLFAPKKQDDEYESGNLDDVPIWVTEAWDWLLRKELGLRFKEPEWLGLPALMRMTMSTPNVMRTNRPDWLSPFNFFLFPILSDLGGYPIGFDKANFKFILPFESDRSEWKSLKGINLWDNKIYRLSMRPNRNRSMVVPESFRIILNKYLRHKEVKSLAPDGTKCTWNTTGLLRRASILAGAVVPIGKETDRHWEQSEDPSLLDFKVKQFRKNKKMVVADSSDRKRWRKAGVRYGQRKSRLSINTVREILDGEPVKVETLAIFSRAMEV